MQDKKRSKLTVFGALEDGEVFLVSYWMNGKSTPVKAEKCGGSMARAENGDYLAMLDGDMVVRLA